MAVLRDPGVFLASGDGAHVSHAGGLKEIMRRLEEGLQRGAVSLGAGFLIRLRANRDELLQVFRIARQYHVSAHVHIRRGVAGLDEAIDLATEAKTSLHVVHINSTGLAADRDLLKLIANAQKRGLDVTTEAYPYAAGMTEIQSANLDEYEGATDKRLAVLEWPRTGERLSRATFQKYRKIGGPIVIHTNTEEMVNVGRQ